MTGAKTHITRSGGSAIAMHVRWFGQAAFLLTHGDHRVLVDPFGPMPALAQRGMRFDYPPIRRVRADLVLVTHEHGDHNAVDAAEGEPRVVRSTAGTFETAVGTLTAIASEHDDAAGTRRGPNTIFAFTFGGLSVCHFGDFGQEALRDAQARAIGRPDLLFLPVGGGPTIDGERAHDIVQRLAPRWVVPMHYRTWALSFLDSAEDFLRRFEPESVHRLRSPEFETSKLPAASGPIVVVPAAPGQSGVAP